MQMYITRTYVSFWETLSVNLTMKGTCYIIWYLRSYYQSTDTHIYVIGTESYYLSYGYSSLSFHIFTEKFILQHFSITEGGCIGVDGFCQMLTDITAVVHTCLIAYSGKVLKQILFELQKLWLLVFPREIHTVSPVSVNLDFALRSFCC